MNPHLFVKIQESLVQAPLQNRMRLRELKISNALDSKGHHWPFTFKTALILTFQNSESFPSLSIVFLSVHIAIDQVNKAIDRQDEMALMAGLNSRTLSLLEVLPQNSSWYLAQLYDFKEQRMQVNSM